MAALAVTTLGCDAVFGLDDVRAPLDGGDALEDTGPCIAPNQDDEDADGVFDACDNCPHVAQLPGDRIDSDLDGIGNACDPHPGKRDTLVLFSGFQTLPPGFETAGGAPWQVSGGKLAFSGGVSDASYLASFGLALRDVTIDAEVELTTMGTLGAMSS